MILKISNIAFHRVIVVAVLLALGVLAQELLTGCTNDEPTVSQAREIRFDIQSEHLMGTRATIINSTSELQSSGEDISIYAYYHDVNNSYLIGDGCLRYVTDHWEFVDGSGNTLHYYWPIEDSYIGSILVSSLDFVGLWPRTGITYAGYNYDTSNGPQLTCTNLPVTSEGQADLKEFMYAYLPNKTYTDQANADGGALPLQFKHPFANIKFQLSAESLTAGVELIQVTIPSIKNNGSGFTDGGSWTPTNSDIDFVATATPSAAIVNVPYIVLPQTVGTKTISVKAKWTDWGEQLEHNLSTSVDLGTWQPGYSYTYTFTVTAKDLKVDVAKYTEQW